MKHKDHLTSAMYEMLGMLDEYRSRGLHHKLQPDSIMATFHPEVWEGEEEDANHFEQLIKKHETAMGTSINWVRVTESAETVEGFKWHIKFHSTKLSEIINSYYIKVDSISALNRKILDGASIEHRLSYLAGAYSRFGRKPKNAFIIANDPEKSEAIASVLASLSCSSIQQFCHEGMPTFNLLLFQPCDTVRDRLGIQETVRNENEFWETPI